MTKNTKIIATVGPVSNSFEVLEKMFLSGVNVFRLNFSHGTHESQQKNIENIRKLEKKVGIKIPIILDTSGPDIRTADINRPKKFAKNDELIFTVDETKFKDEKFVGVNYTEFINDVKVGDKILIDSGVMNVKVLKIEGTEVITKVLDGGKITSRRHINIPNAHISLDPVTKKDWKDLSFGIKMDFDFIAQSFVREASDVQLIKDFLNKNKSGDTKIIAKIETTEAVKNISEILEVADGVMVARGDLGAEIPFEKVPSAQRKIISEAEKSQKFVIVATQMLESMIENPIPTRAETTDVSLAVFQRADSTMLSGESASGKFPVKSVEVMTKILSESEKEFAKTSKIRDIKTKTAIEGLYKSASQLSENSDEEVAIIVFSRTGKTAQFVSSFRPKTPIFSFSNSEKIASQIQIFYGISGEKIDFHKTDTEKNILKAKNIILEKHPNFKNKKFILVSAVLVDKKLIHSVQIREF